MSIKTKPSTYLQAFDAIVNENESLYLIPDDTDTLVIDDELSKVHKDLLYKQMTGETFLKLLKKDTILKKASYNLIESVYLNKEPTVNPLVLDENKLLHSLYKYDLNKHNCLSKFLSKDTFKNYLEENSNSFPKKLCNWMTADEYEQILKNSLDILESKCYVYNNKYCTPICLEESLKEIYEILKTVDFELHIGHAGCGKSSDIAKKINALKCGSVLEVSLSNTVCNMFKQKIYNTDIVFETRSCTSASFATPKTIGNKTVVIIDEFSQWGYYELDLFKKLIENNLQAKFYIMGDPDQIPTFLSNGSLLYSIKESFPDKVVEHNTQYRFMNNPDYKDLITEVQNGNWPENTYIKEKNDIILGACDIVVTGTNKHVEQFNTECFNIKHNTKVDSDYIKNNFYDLCRMYQDIPLICNTTKTITHKGANYKIYCNTRYKIENVGKDYIRLVSTVDGSVIFVNMYTIKNFDLCYSITVNKSQGLEWENVVVYIDQSDFNLKSYNSLYVAISRGINTLILTTTKGKYEYKKSDIKATLNKKYKFINDFYFLNYNKSNININTDEKE